MNPQLFNQQTVSKIDTDRLTELEEIINGGLQSFVEVGNALFEIRNKGMYKATHKTFESYCREKWKMSRTHAYRLIASSEVVKNLSPIGDILPPSEGQARELTDLEADRQRDVWIRAIQLFNGSPTAKQIRKIKAETISLSSPKPKKIKTNGQNVKPVKPIGGTLVKQAFGAKGFFQASLFLNSTESKLFATATDTRTPPEEADTAWRKLWILFTKRQNKTNERKA